MTANTNDYAAWSISYSPEYVASDLFASALNAAEARVAAERHLEACRARNSHDSSTLLATCV
jgi:hypothetical protein